MSFENKEKVSEKYDAPKVTGSFRKPGFVTEVSENAGSNELLKQPGFRSHRLVAK
jgi:hypothetical protein